MEAGLAFGKILRQLRLDAGLTQEQLAYEADLQRNYISMMERNVNQPTITTLFKLASALHISAAQMMAEVERMMNEND